MDTNDTNPANQQLEVFLSVMQRIIPAPWISNHYLESQSFVGVTYPVIDSLCQGVAASTVEVVRRRTKRTDSRTSPVVKRAMSSAGANEQDQEWEPIDETDEAWDAQELFNRPNPRQSINNILYESTLQDCLTGVDYTWKVPNGYGEPCELYVIPTAMTVASGGTGAAGSTRYPNGAYQVMPINAFGPYAIMPGNTGSSGAVIPAEQMAVNRIAHPWATWDGYSPLQACAIQRDVLAQIDEARWAAFAQGVNPSGFLETPPGTTQTQVDQINLKLTQKYAGAKNTGAMMALLGGMKAVMNTKSVADVAGDSVWEQLTSFMCAVYRVPKPIVGLHTTTSYAELFAALKQFHMNLQQRTNFRAQFWTRELVDPSWGTGYRVQINLPSIDDEEMMLRRMNFGMKAKILTKGRAMRMFNWPTFGDERDEEICGDPTAAERQQQEQQFALEQEKMKQGQMQQGPNADKEEIPYPDNENGKGALGGAKRAAVLNLFNGNGSQHNGNGHVKRAAFREEDHPRDGGKFATKPGSNSDTETSEDTKEKPAVKQEAANKLDPVDEQELSDGPSAEGKESVLDSISEGLEASELGSLKEQFAGAVSQDLQPYADLLRKYGAAKDVERANRKADKLIAKATGKIDKTAAKVEGLDKQIADAEAAVRPDDFDYQAFAESQIPELTDEEESYPPEVDPKEFGFNDDTDWDELEANPTPEYQAYQQAEQEREVAVEKSHDEYIRQEDKRERAVERLAEKEERTNEKRQDQLTDLKDDRASLLSGLRDDLESDYDDISSLYYDIFTEGETFSKFYDDEPKK